MRNVSLRQLSFLAETARAGSLAGAAAELHVTAPAIAQQLRILERGVGLPLIERGPRGQQLTEAGRFLYLAYERIAAELEAVSEDLDALRDAHTGTVHVGAVSTSKYFTPYVIAAFRRRHPEVQVSLSVGNRDEVIDLLEGFHIDFAIMGRPPQRLDVVAEEFGDHPYVIIASPSHRLANEKALTRARIAGERFLAREPGSGTHQHLMDLFDDTPEIASVIASNETIKHATMAGLGVALISGHTVAAEVGDGRLVVLDVAGLPIMRHWLLVRMSRRAVSPAAQALWHFALTEAEAMLPR